MTSRRPHGRAVRIPYDRCNSWVSVRRDDNCPCWDGEPDLCMISRPGSHTADDECCMRVDPPTGECPDRCLTRDLPTGAVIGDAYVWRRGDALYRAGLQVSRG
jgi:hypothetical protein